MKYTKETQKTTDFFLAIGVILLVSWGIYDSLSTMQENRQNDNALYLSQKDEKISNEFRNIELNKEIPLGTYEYKYEDYTISYYFLGDNQLFKKIDKNGKQIHFGLTAYKLVGSTLIFDPANAYTSHHNNKSIFYYNGEAISIDDDNIIKLHRHNNVIKLKQTKEIIPIQPMVDKL